MSGSEHELQAMPDEVKGKKIGDFAYWIRLRSDLGDATILAFKQAESEKKAIGAEASLSEAKARGHYNKESGGNTWDTIIVTKEYGVLPIETWKSRTGQEKIRSAIADVSGATTYVGLGGSFVAGNTASFYHCKNCGEPIVFASADGLCPSCGKKFTI